MVESSRNQQPCVIDLAASGFSDYRFRSPIPSIVMDIVQHRVNKEKQNLRKNYSLLLN